MTAWRLEAFALGCYGITTFCVVTAILVGNQYLVNDARPMGPLEVLGGGPYARIAANGYSYVPGTAANTAYFPALPLVVGLLMRFTGLDALTCTMVVGQLSLFAAFVLLARYLAVRRPPFALDDAEQRWTLAAFAAAPTAVFLRQGISEPLFLALLAAVLLAIELRWPLIWIALAAGAAAGARPVGAAIGPAVVWHAWQRLERRPARFAKLCGLGVLSVWGLLAYMAYLGAEFGEPLAMAKSQWVWLNRPPFAWREKLLALATFEPLWGVFVPGHVGYWHDPASPSAALLNIRFLNPVFFGAAAAAVGYGSWRRWLTASEIIVATGLLLIPWYTRAYEMALQSHARFALVVVPAYLVAGKRLARLPVWLAWSLITASAAWMCMLSSLYGAGYVML